MERAESTLKGFGKSKIFSSFDDDGNRLPSLKEEKESEGIRMDDVWLKLRKKGYLKNDIVGLALREAIKDYLESDQKCLLMRLLINMRW